MNKFRLLGAMCATSLFFSMASQAASFDFSGANGYIGAQETRTSDNGVTASGYYYDGGWIPAPLWQRNDGPTDNGIGVCSE